MEEESLYYKEERNIRIILLWTREKIELGKRARK